MIIRGIGYRVFYIHNDIALVQSEEDALSNPSYNYHTSDQTHPAEDGFEEGFSGWDNSVTNEFAYSRYLVVRAGHTADAYIPLRAGVHVKTSKKNRKLVIYGADKQAIYDIARKVYEYRTPSAYTGRGIRRKHVKVLRKKGKRDKGR